MAIGIIPINLRFPIANDNSSPDVTKRYGTPTRTGPGARTVNINVPNNVFISLVKRLASDLVGVNIWR